MTDPAEAATDPVEAAPSTSADVEPESAPESAPEAIEAEYSEVATEPAAEVAVEEPVAPRESKRTRRTRRRAKAKPDDLATRAAAENVWVREDLRRIGIISVILFVALAIAWVVFVGLDVLSLY